MKGRATLRKNNPKTGRIEGRTPLEKIEFYTKKKTETCWLWTGGKDRNGYGILAGFETPFVHRTAWILFRGPIRSDEYVVHSCRVRHCLNPDHLIITSRNAKTKLTYERAAEIRKLRAEGLCFSSLAQQFGLARSTIWQLVHGLTWKVLWQKTIHMHHQKKREVARLC